MDEAGKTGKKFESLVFMLQFAEGRKIQRYRKEQIVFSQGAAADAVFYIQKGKVKLAVLSEHGREAVVAILSSGDFFGEGCLAGRRGRADFRGNAAKQRSVIHLYHAALRSAMALSLRFSSSACGTDASNG